MSFTSALKSYLTGSGIPLLDFFKDSGTGGEHIFSYTDIENEIGLGAFSLPVLSFNDRVNLLKKTNPELSPDKAAAVAYFGMLAERPAPSGDYEAFYINPENSTYINLEDGENFSNWLTIEEYVRSLPKRAESMILGGPLKYATKYAGLTKTDANTAYYKNLKRLQDWIAANGLYGGIKKTLSEQSRKLQGIQAGILASKQAAARALALSQITDEMTEDARIEAAENIAKNQKKYDEAIEQEAELNKKLDNIKNGLPADYQSGEMAAGGVPVLPLLAGGLLLFWLGTRKGKK